MTRFGWLVIGLLVVIIAVLGTFYSVAHRAMHARVSITASSTPVVDPSAYAIYTSGTYGFTFFYPANARLSDSFATSSAMLTEWRENAVATGTLVASVVTPAGEARIGVSSAKKETAACEKAGSAEKEQSSLTFASTTWNVFTFDRLGTDDESRITSYRTLHNKLCYALETIEPLPQTATSTIAAPDDIIRSFTFASS